MKSTIKSIFQIILGIITLPFLCAIMYFVFKTNQTYAVLYIPSGISILLIIIFRKKEAYYIPSIIITSAVLLFYLYGNSKTDSSKYNQIYWKTNTHSTVLPFFIHPSGHIYIKTTIFGEDKYLLFDTGSDISLLNEKYNTSNLLTSLNMTDSQDITKKTDFFTIDKLVFGDLELKKLQYGTMKKEIWENCGILHNQDSIIGILGNNVINNFVWDLDMVNHTMQISDQPFKEEIEGAKIVPLINNGKSWSVRFKLNGKTKKIKLDSGNSSILCLEEKLHLPKTYIYPITNASKSKGVFSYTKCDSSQNKNPQESIQKIERKIFANLNIADTTYNDILVIDNAKSSLLGIPLFWEYKRVVLDFMSKKMYLITPIKHQKKFSISNISASERMSARIGMIKHQGYFEKIYNNPKTLQIESTKSKDILTYKFIDTVKYYATIDSKTHIFNMDSIVGKGIVLNKDTILKSSESEKSISIIMKNLNLINLNKHLSD
jgi:hypothetical protein